MERRNFTLSPDEVAVLDAVPKRTRSLFISELIKAFADFRKRLGTRAVGAVLSGNIKLEMKNET